MAVHVMAGATGLALLALLVAGLSGSALGADPSAHDAGKPVQQRIRENAELSYLNNHLQVVANLAVSITEDPDLVLAIAKQHEIWLKNQHQPCLDEVCLGDAYQRRIAELRAIVQRHAAPFPQTGAWHMEYPLNETDGSSYCSRSGAKTYGDFDIWLQRDGERICGGLYYLYECGRKVPTGIFRGAIVGNLAIVDFHGGFREPLWGKAYLAISTRGLHWEVFLKIQGEGYFPDSEVLEFRSGSRPRPGNCDALLEAGSGY